MLKEFVDRLLALSVVEVKTIEERSYSDRQLHPVKPPLPEPLKLHTLTGLVDYIKTDLDNHDVDSLALHVVDHGTVRLLSWLDDQWQNRRVYVDCEIFTQDDFDYDDWLSAEDFVINVQSHFAYTDERRQLLSVVGNMTSEKVNTSTDDGITQTVGSRAGVALVSKKELPNPIMLQPYRTFAEVDQPESPFVFRVKQSREDSLPLCALFKVGGHNWELEAISRISAYLKGAVPEIKVIA